MEFDKEKYKVLDSKSKEVIHWKINPLLAINELALGHRVPEVLLIDKTSDKPLLDRGYVPCPHCGTIHDSRTWSKQNNTVYKNWYGYFCPECQQVIPCVRNWTAQLLLLLSQPFRKGSPEQRKQRWLAVQPTRFQNLSFDPVQVDWRKLGLKWGFFMFLAMGIGFPLLFPMFVPDIEYHMVLDPRFILLMTAFMAPVCVLCGLLFGFVMKKSLGQKGVPVQKENTAE